MKTNDLAETATWSVLWKMCSEKFHKIFTNIPLPGPLFWYRSRPKASNFIKKETLAQVLSCEFCKFFKNIFFTEHLWATASEVSN